MAEYRVWRVGDSEFDDRMFDTYAEDSANAAEQWAAWSDNDNADHAILGGEHVTVMVRRGGDSPKRYTVTGESVPRYTARLIQGEEKA